MENIANAETPEKPQLKGLTWTDLCVCLLVAPEHWFPMAMDIAPQGEFAESTFKNCKAGLLAAMELIGQKFPEDSGKAVLKFGGIQTRLLRLSDFIQWRFELGLDPKLTIPIRHALMTTIDLGQNEESKMVPDLHVSCRLLGGDRAPSYDIVHRMFREMLEPMVQGYGFIYEERNMVTAVSKRREYLKRMGDLFEALCTIPLPNATLICILNQWLSTESFLSIAKRLLLSDGKMQYTSRYDARYFARETRIMPEVFKAANDFEIATARFEGTLTTEYIYDRKPLVPLLKAPFQQWLAASAEQAAAEECEQRQE